MMPMQTQILTRLTETNQLINRFLLKEKIEPRDYLWKTYVLPYLKEQDIHLIEELPTSSMACFSAFTVKSRCSTAIFLNPNIPLGRKNFSICHELNHCLFDFNQITPAQSFFRMEENPSLYKKEELAVEHLANAGAGVFMLPDITILAYLDQPISFPKMAEQLEMTQAALYIRLTQFMLYRTGISLDQARRVINLFRYYGKKEALQRYLSGWGSTVRAQIILDYENC